MKRVVAFVLAMSITAPARADDVETCIASADVGQAARRRGELVKARASFVACSDAACPSAVRTDCTRWLDEVDALLPRLSIRATDSEGHDVEAQLTVDGTKTTQTSMTLDPGLHLVHAEAPGLRPNETQVRLVEGERSRVITVVLLPVVRVEVPRSLETPVPPSSAPPLPSIVLYGVAAVGLGTFGAFGLMGHARASDLRDGCGATSTCNPRDVDDARHKYLVADIGLGVGIVAAAAATIYWITR